MRFLLDMGISPKTAEFLRSEGHDAIHLFDVNLGSAADREIIAMARQQQRVILTHDLDFGNLMAASREQLPSVIIFRLTDMKSAIVNEYIQVIIAHYTGVLLAGAVLSVSKQRVRIRRLPIAPKNP